ncbi:hypothetical protein GCM10009576_011400 [Streptomyces rhizosphaericus]|uniref:Uncharacterized protein n=1 Tax=Streptomyces rhizosphaericus TaxID=114699 RepID=A0ABN1S2L5_9ACTN
MERGMDVAADFPVGLMLDADAVGAGRGCGGQGVAAHHGGGVADGEADGEVLARAGLGVADRRGPSWRCDLCTRAEPGCGVPVSPRFREHDPLGAFAEISTAL